MAFFEDELLGGLAPGVAVGLGAIILGPAVLGLLGSLARPLAKSAIKGGLMLYGQGRTIIAETREILEDLVAESKSELTVGHAAASPSHRAQGMMETEGGAV